MYGIRAYFSTFSRVEPFLKAPHQGEKSDPDPHQIKNKNTDQSDTNPHTCLLILKLTEIVNGRSFFFINFKLKSY
jgi:hypothetical protein